MKQRILTALADLGTSWRAQWAAIAEVEERVAVLESKHN
jgi:hypothetical protein